MLTHPTTERLHELGLIGMARALEEQRRHPDSHDLSFEDRLAMLVDREALERDSKRLAARLRFAGLREPATPEDVNYRAARGLDRALFQRLTGGVPSVTVRAATTARCCISACPGCWKRWPWLEAMDAMPAC